MIDFEKLNEIRKEISGLGHEVTLIAATKTQSSDTIRELMKIAPDITLGENRVQELIEKYDPAYKWHLIGQLQTNKVKYIIDKVDLIHSLDRDDLLKEIEKQASKHGRIQPCLVEINMGAEITKGGVSPDALEDFLYLADEYPHIKVEGLMSVLPNLGDTPELHKMYERLSDMFRKAKELKLKNGNVRYLSAGMSNDYKIALAHGANMIRLGRVIFGERVYPQNAI